MYDSNYPSSKKRSSNIQDTTYLPTAERSPYHESYITRTPNRSQPSSVPLQHDRLSETRRSIDEIIQQVSAKKSLNQEAIEEVRNVNQEIVAHLGSNPVRSAQNQQRIRTPGHNRVDSRDIVVTSQFQWRPQGSQEDLRRSHQDSIISQQNLDLRSRLNEEIRRNNDLMRYVKELETENATLRSSRNIGSSQQGSNVNALMEENRYLRSQLSQSQQGYGGDLMEELRRLKEENSQLRKDTITLLNGKQY